MAVKLYRYYRWVQSVESIGGPKFSFPAGTLAEHPPPRYLSMLREQAAACGQMFRIWLGPLQPVVIVCHPETVRALIAADPPKAPMFYRYVQYWLGEQSLLLQEGAAWKSARTLITPAFHFSILQEYAEVAREPTHELVEKMLTHAAAANSNSNDVAAAEGEGKQGASGSGGCGDGGVGGQQQQPLELFHTLSLYTLDVLCRCSLSYESHCQQNSEDEYVECLEEVAALIIKRVETVAHVFDAVYKRSDDGKRFYALCDRMHSIADSFIDRRCEELKGRTAQDVSRGSGRRENNNNNNNNNNNSSSNKAASATASKTASKKLRLDFLDRLILARDEDGQPLTREEIRHQVDTFLFAGHDTTASAISWLLWNLSHHPEIQERCRAEVDAVLGDAHPEYAQLGQLPYLSAVVKESLRMHPPVVGVARRLNHSLELDGHVLPAGTTVVANSYALHHNPKVWSDPEEFQPERFMGGAARDAYSFMPFSIGARNCIGQNFAQNEIKIAAACILQRLVILPATEMPPKPVAKIVLRSDNGIHVRLMARE